MAAAAKPDRFDALEAYVAELQEALGVTVWKITVVREASDVEAWADINPHEQAESAELRVSYDFWKQTPEHQREILDDPQPEGMVPVSRGDDGGHGDLLSRTG